MVTELIFELLAKTENEPSMKIEISKLFIPLYTRTWFMHALFDLAAVCFALQGRSLSFTGYQIAYAVWGMYSIDASRLCKCCTRAEPEDSKRGAEKNLARTQHRSKPTTHHPCGDCTITLEIQEKKEGTSLSASL